MKKDFIKKNIILIIFFLIYMILAYLKLFSIPCLVRLLTGFYCPGCGVTRMIISIAKLDFYQAFRYNPLVFILLPFLIFMFFSKNKYKYEKIYYVIIVLLIVFGVMRNIPYFKFLAPTNIMR